AEREVLRTDTGLGQGVEQGGFADAGQSDDTAIESHTGVLCRGCGENESGLDAVQALHDAGPVAGEQAGDLAERLIDAGVQRLLLVLRCATENVACDLRGMAGVADAQPQAMKSVVVAQTGDGVAQSVVPAMSATLLAFHHTGGQVELVVSDQDFLGGDAVEARHGGNGQAAAVHEGSRDEQTKVLTVESETT